MIQKLTTTPGQVVTFDNIMRILNDARATFEYAKFICPNNVFITIDYHRDRTISISTNSRDIGLWARIESLRSGYTQNRVADMLFYWVNMFNRSMMK